MKKKKIKCELIREIEWERIGENLHRSRVPDGWLVKHGRTGMFYVPDKNKSWKIPLLWNSQCPLCLKELKENDNVMIDNNRKVHLDCKAREVKIKKGISL